MSISRIVTGVERDRLMLRGAALRIIRTVLEMPPFKPPERPRRDWLAPPHLTAFRRLEPLGWGISDMENECLFLPQDCTPDVVWPLDVGTIVEKSGHGSLLLARHYTIRPKDVRGYAKRFSPFMVRGDYAVGEWERLRTDVRLYAWIGGQWSDAECKANATKVMNSDIPNRDDYTDAADKDQPALATSIALRQRYEWSVSLGLEHSPSIRFSTDPTGVQDIFRIRDLPEGRDRREQLLLWVTDHWRQDRNDPGLERYVRRHLRGATQFSWQGMDCELTPSQFDIDQRDRLIAERAIMRTDGTDRRPRT